MLCMPSLPQDVFKIYHRAVPRSADPGGNVFVSMTILRLPYAMLVGVLITFTALIPMIGAFIGCAVGAFLILMVSPMQALFFIILFLVLQQIEGNLIYPHVVGNSVVFLLCGCCLP